MSGKVRHLLTRNGRYYARLAVPAALRSLIGKRELSEALGADRTKALRALPGAVARMQAVLDGARAERDPRPRVPVRAGRRLSAREMALAHYQDQCDFDIECRNTDSRYGNMGVDDTLLAPLKRCISGAANDAEMTATVGWIFKKFGNSIQAETGSPEWRQIGRALAMAELESLGRTMERDEGDWSGKTTLPIFTEQPKAAPPKDALAARILSDDSTKTLKELLPDFLKERGSSEREDFDSVICIRAFDEIMGEAKPVYQITKADVLAYKKAVSDAPSNSTKRFPGMTLPQAIKANNARQTPFPRLEARTVNAKYVMKLKTILGWCTRNEIIPDNPADGIKVESVKKKGVPKRLPFSPTDLTSIFDPEFFRTPTVSLEEQWAMDVSLFSGMRASELAQLKLDSIRHERGILVFAIEEATKTAGSQRIVPVHSQLVERGLLDRVAELRKKRATHLFPNWYQDGMDAQEEAKKNGKHTGSHCFPRFIPRRFNDTYMKKVGVKHAKKSWHSWRHTFKTGLARAGVVKSVRDELCGHVDSSAGATYVHDTSIEALKEAIEKLTFDGLPLGWENPSSPPDFPRTLNPLAIPVSKRKPPFRNIVQLHKSF